MDHLLSVCRTCFEAGVAAADPAAALRRAMARRAVMQAAAGKTALIAVGKAAAPMMREALLHLAPDQALLVTNYENAVEIDGVICHAAGHPTPDQAGAEAAAAIISILEGLGAGDHVILLLSGGGSALIPAPVDGGSLANKSAVYDLMLAIGAPSDFIFMVLKRRAQIGRGS